MRKRPTIVVLDFGSQYSQLITRRLRELGVFSELVGALDTERLAGQPDLAGIILSGGLVGLHDDGSPPFPASIAELDVPILGICSGLHLLCRQYGGVVAGGPQPEYGEETLEVLQTSRLFRGTPSHQQVWMSHGECVQTPPDGFEVLGRSSGSLIAAIACEERRLFGLQFHPEVSHSEFGMQILENFVRQICGIEEAWDRGDFVDEQIDSIRRRVGDRSVLCAVSGGVNSTVAATMVERAVGDRLTAVFVNNGLLRRGEPDEVAHRLGQVLHGNLVIVDASEIFLDRLSGVEDPEAKRDVIGQTFNEVFESTAKEHGPFDYLVRGTLYPDRIESMSSRGPSQPMRTHHDDRRLPDRLGFELIEPLAELFKDEVRAIGREIGIGADLLNRHPFPGPGLAVRCLGAVDASKLAILREADHIFIEELKQAGLYDRIWQAGCVLLPVKSVGVMGDVRTYESPVVLRAVTSRDAMTADWARIPDNVLDRIANRIVREVDGINRVVYDITSKPPATIEWE